MTDNDKEDSSDDGSGMRVYQNKEDRKMMIVFDADGQSAIYAMSYEKFVVLVDALYKLREEIVQKSYD